MAIKIIRKGAIQNYPNFMKCPECGQESEEVKLRIYLEKYQNYVTSWTTIEAPKIPVYYCSHCGSQWPWSPDESNEQEDK